MDEKYPEQYTSYHPIRLLCVDSKIVAVTIQKTRIFGFIVGLQVANSIRREF